LPIRRIIENRQLTKKLDTNMNNENAKKQYALLFSGSGWDKGLPLEELEKAMAAVKAWFDGLEQRGIVKAGQALEPEGRVISARNGRPASDGPFVESKETIGGFLMLETDSLEEAVAIAKSNPILKYGGSTEVRLVADECPTFRRVRQRLALAAAA